MITPKDAKKIAENETEKWYGSHIKLLNSLLDDGTYYIFDNEYDIDDSVSLAVNKYTGEVIEYFPPDHSNDFLRAKKIDI